MTTVLLEPFDSLSAWALAGTTPPSIVAGGRTGNGMTTGTDAAGTASYTIPGASESDTLTIGFAWRCSDLAALRIVADLRSDAGASLHNRIQVDSGGRVQFNRGTSITIAQSAAGVITAGVWYYIEIQSKLGDAPNGAVTIRVNEIQVAAVSAVDTKSGGTKTGYDQVRLLNPAAGASALFDDFYLLSGAGEAFMGDIELPLTPPGPSTTIVDVFAQDHLQRIAVLVDTGSFDADWFLLQRQWAGRSEPVRGDDPLDPTHFVARGSPQYLFDVEAPRGTPITYALTAGTDDNSAAESAVWTTPVVHGVSCDWWAAPLSEPTDALTFEPEDQSDLRYAVAHGEYRALGRADPIVLFGTRQTAAGTLSARSPTYPAAEELVAVLGRPEVMVLRSAPSTGWGLAGRRYAALGPIGYIRSSVRPVAPVGPLSQFSVDLPWTEVLPGNVAIVRFGSTYQDVANNFTSYTEVASTFATYLDIVLWTPPP